ncbi:MAG: hypothetical protein WAW88_03025 [Nocardioides sp.]
MLTRSVRTHVRLGAAATLMMLSLAACGEQTTASDDSDSGSGGSGGSGGSVAAPAAVPAAPGKVTGLGMVIDSGEGAEVCFGPIGESYPPTCEGIPVSGWKWKQVRGGFEHIQKVKFGMFAVTGTFDGTTLTVTDEPISAALYDPMPDPSAVEIAKTRCATPDGGWAVGDPMKASANALEAATRVAAAQSGYVTSWTDQFAEVTVPPYDADPDPDMGDDGPMDPLPVVLNVLIDGDVEAAEAAIAKEWGGALCVTEPDHSQAEIDEATDALQAVPGVLGVVPTNGTVVVNTLYDDGSLQDYADSNFAEGLVKVAASLRDVG